MNKIKKCYYNEYIEETFDNNAFFEHAKKLRRIKMFFEILNFFFLH